MFEGNGDKSPVPNGFNLESLEKYWDTDGEETMLFIQEFYKKGKLSKDVTASSLALIPKCDFPLRLEDYRPICLISSTLKIIPCIHVGRLRKVIGRFISNNQTAFVPGPQILGCVLVTNEILDYVKRKKKECLVFKDEFEQAYDCVDWNYLRLMLRRMGFGESWMVWMEVVVLSSSMSVIFNGSPTHDFKVMRGLRKCPLSPFLFMIVVEGLAFMMRKATERWLYKGFKIDDSKEYSLL